MRAFVTTFGTSGDENPLIAVGRAMAAAGHEVDMFTNPSTEEKVRAAGLGFRPVGDPVDLPAPSDLDKYVHPVTGPSAILNDLYVPHTAHTLRVMSEAIEASRPDVVVSHSMCLGGPLVAGRAGVPSVVVALAPCWWISREDPSIYGPQTPPRWLHPHLMWFPRWLVNTGLFRAMAPMCRELGFDLRRRAFSSQLDDAKANIGLWSPAFRPPVADDPPRAAVCGFPLDDNVEGGTALDARVQAFLDDGDPPVVVGLGTMARNFGAELYRAVAVACSRLDLRCILIGAPEDLAGDLPEGSLCVPYASYEALFPRAAIVVHSTGIGTAADAIRSGRPSLIVPFASDQYDNARRAKQLGIAETLRRAKATPDRLTEVLGRLRDDADLQQRAAELGEVVLGESCGARRAAQHIEATIAG